MHWLKLLVLFDLRECAMLNKQQLSTIYHAIDYLPENGAADLLEIIADEFAFQKASEPLWDERDRILSKATIGDVEVTQLKALGEQLEKLSANRPAEFGGQFTALDIEAANIIRQARPLLDGYVSVDRALLQDIRFRLRQMSLIVTSEMLKTAGTYTDQQKVDLDSINDQIDRLDKVLGISGEARS
jgi:hypothetical protein